MNIILKKPVFSEKSMQQAKQGWYTFIVEKSARKPVIAKAVEEQFGVKVTAVKTANFRESSRMQRSRKGHFTLPGFKKAVVALRPGQTIGLFAAAEVKPEEEQKEVVKEKKSLLKQTKVKIEKGGEK